MDPYEDRVLTAIAESLADIPDLQESPYMLSNPTAPTAEIMPGAIEFDETFQRGRDHYNAVIRVTVGTSVDLGAQKLLRRFRSPSGPDSIKAAVEQDRTLGGLTDDLNVNRTSPVRMFRRPNGDTVLGCDFEVEFEGSGTET